MSQIGPRLLAFIEKNPQFATLSPCLAALDLAFAANCLRIGFRCAYYREFFRKKLQKQFEELISACLGADVLVVYNDVSPRIKPVEPDDEAEPFAGFIESPKNGPVLAAARKVCGIAAPDFDLLILTGPSGSGKSCLLAAVAAAIANSRRASVIHCAARAFLPEEAPEKFWQKPRALLLDDIQELADDPAAQSFLASHIDACRNAKVWTRMVFALASADLSIFCRRLAARLEQGLALPLAPPDLATRMTYIEKNAAKLGLRLDKAQITALARHATRLSAIRGLLQKMKFYGSISDHPLEPEEIEKLAPEAGWRQILMAVAERLGLKPSEIMGQSRRRELARARQATMFLCRVRLGLSYPELGRIFGGRDHSTVIHGIKKIQQLRQTDKVLHKLLTELESGSD